ncbi:ABC transporter permease [Tardiphaga sp. 42S5]|uniref:ABC transporter permease n=1 Tax=Tardiphaga sp. 42S5 TaxID=1404799 RepID=UPI002A5AAF9C|nr:ABC transporter permease [Tardiphaga sp. 42S5]WPO41164.1 ABC transporter permease [Tardiphaga sp. 42S5]
MSVTIQLQRRSGMGQFLSAIPGAGLLLILMLVLFTIINPRFVSQTNLVNVGLQTSLLLMLALPMTLIIMTEGLDLSAGALLGLSGVIVAEALLAGWGVLAACTATLAVSIAFGALNGILIAYLSLPAFVVTLGTMGLMQGIALVLTNGDPVGGFTPAIETFYRSQLWFIPTPIAIAAALYAALWLLLYRTRLGNYVIAIGGNKDALRLAGIRANLVHLAVYVLGSAIIGLSAVLLIGRTNSAHPTVGIGMEFEAIAAVVLGGTSFEKGQGWLFGAVLGALAITVLRNGLNILSIDSSLQVVCIGILLILALLIDQARKQFVRRTA